MKTKIHIPSLAAGIILALSVCLFTGANADKPDLVSRSQLIDHFTVQAQSNLKHSLMFPDVPLAQNYFFIRAEVYASVAVDLETNPNF